MTNEQRRSFFGKIAVGFMIFAISVLSAVIQTGCNNSEAVNMNSSDESRETTSDEIFSAEVTGATEDTVINVWYTNSELSSYLKTCSMIFENSYDVEVKLELVSSIDYIESVNKETIDGNVIDVYIVNTELLEKAYLAGLATENTDITYNTDNYPQIALTASTYKGKLIGYPLYYDTSFFLYNRDYVEAPLTFQDIINFSETYESENYPGVESIIQWDAKNLFYNYSFAGAYLNLGGKYGDDSSVIDIANNKVINALTFYKKINQALYFDASDSSQENVLSNFINGKVLYTMSSTEFLADIITSKVNYGICKIPALNGELDTKPVSINYTVVVNAYSVNKQAAQKFAKSLTYDYADNFYTSVKKLPAKRLSNYPNDEWKHIAEQYEETAVLPKLMAAINYRMELEVALNDIWNETLDEEPEVDGGDSLTEEEYMAIRQQMMEEIMKEHVSEEMRRLQKQMELQIN